jgi:hypothetical protein
MLHDHPLVCTSGLLVFLPSILVDTRDAGLYFVAMNYGVHSIMYFYYFLAAVKYRAPWAGLVTFLQVRRIEMSSLSGSHSPLKPADLSNVRWCGNMYRRVLLRDCSRLALLHHPRELLCGIDRECPTLK